MVPPAQHQEGETFMKILTEVIQTKLEDCYGCPHHWWMSKGGYCSIKRRKLQEKYAHGMPIWCPLPDRIPSRIKKRKKEKRLS